MPEKQISELVKHYYHDLDINCAKTTLGVLGGLFDCPLEQQLFLAASGMNGGGRSRAQCGLVEGAIMFMGVYFGQKGVSDDDVCVMIKRFIKEFKAEFGSISCAELRPGGFKKDDPPHMCEGLTVRSLVFCHSFINNLGKAQSL